MCEVWWINQVTKRLQKVRVSNRTARKGEFSAFTDVSSSAHKCCRLWTLLSQNTGSSFHTKTVKFTCQETSWMVKTPSPSLSLGERKWQCGSRLYQMRISPISPVESYLKTTIHCKAWKQKKKTENRWTSYYCLGPSFFFPGWNPNAWDQLAFHMGLRIVVYHPWGIPKLGWLCSHGPVGQCWSCIPCPSLIFFSKLALHLWYPMIFPSIFPAFCSVSNWQKTWCTSSKLLASSCRAAANTQKPKKWLSWQNFPRHALAQWMAIPLSQLVAHHNLQHVHTAYVAQLNLVLGFNSPRTWTPLKHVSGE